MIIRQSRLIISRLLAVTVSTLFCLRAFSVEIPLETRSFTPVEGGDSFVEEGNLYVSTFDDTAFAASNARDIVIIEDMSSLTFDTNDEDNDDDDTHIIAANYSGYNTVSGETTDAGTLVFEIPIEESAFYASNVRGFYRNAGPWIQRQDNQSFFFEGTSGTLSYQSLSKARDVDIVLNGAFEGESFTIVGESFVNVLTTDFISIPSWDAAEGSDYDFAFVSATLQRRDNEYIGFLKRNDTEDPTNWESLFAIFRLTDNNDSDGDGVPDLSDLGADQILGVLSTHSIDLGGNQYWSSDLNTTVSVDAKHFWVYGENIGWFYLPDQDDPHSIRVYIADQRLGWLTTNEEMSPYYLRESDNVLVYFDRVDGNVSFYDSALEAWFTVTY